MNKRGFTLIEVMTVVAITGLLTALSVAGYQSVTRNGRTNGETDVMTQFLKDARLRSVASGCPHVVRYNGQHFGTLPGTLMMYRKGGDCSMGATPSVNTSSAPLDVLVNTYVLAPNMVVTSSSAASDLDAKSVVTGFTTSGVPVSAYFAGSWVGLGSATHTLTIKASPTEQYSRQIVITGAGDVYSK